MFRFHAFWVAAHLALATLTAQAAEIVVDRTSLTAIAEDGTRLTGPDLAGVEMLVADEAGAAIRIRIDGAERDPWEDGRWLYALSAQDAVSGTWSDFCIEGPNGLTLGFPVAGTSTPDGGFAPSETQITFSCTAGALAKCIRFGYSPWDNAADGTPLLDAFRACTRMVRADYCGDGTPHTRDGTIINIYDRLGIQSPDDPEGFNFEAAWGPDGAICVAHTRWQQDFSMQDLLASCGDRLEQRTGASCTLEAAENMPGAVVFNDSRGR